MNVLITKENTFGDNTVIASICYERFVQEQTTWTPVLTACLPQSWCVFLSPWYIMNQWQISCPKKYLSSSCKCSNCSSLKPVPFSHPYSTVIMKPSIHLTIGQILTSRAAFMLERRYKHVELQAVICVTNYRTIIFSLYIKRSFIIIRIVIH